MDAQTQKDNALSLLRGGTEIEVRLLDGTPEKVLVRRLPIRDYPRMAECLNDELQLVELYCDKPPGWAEQLKPESHTLLADEGERLNFPNFDPWLERRTRTLKRLQPVLGSMNPETLERVRALASQKSSATSAPPAG